MKTLTAPFEGSRKIHTADGHKWLGSITASLREILSLAVAVAAAAVVVTLSVWLAGRDIGPLMAACTCGLGFIFLALAVDGKGLLAALYWITGIALPALAFLQDRVSPDFVIVSGVLLASWAGHSILKRIPSQVV